MNVTKFKTAFKTFFGLEPDDEKVKQFAEEMENSEQATKVADVAKVSVPKPQIDNKPTYEDLLAQNSFLSSSLDSINRELATLKNDSKARDEQIAKEAKARREKEVANSIEKAIANKILPAEDKEKVERWRALLTTDFETANSVLHSANPIVTPPKEAGNAAGKSGELKDKSIPELMKIVADEAISEIK